MGGLFPQFFVDGSAIDELGVRQMAAVQLAFDRVNNKNDRVYGNLLPTKQVCAVNKLRCIRMLQFGLYDTVSFLCSSNC